MITDHFTNSNGVSIHYVKSYHNNNGLTPVVYVPGALGFAEQFKNEMKMLSPRTVISISLRGRGKSAAPPSNYSFQDHVNDIKTVVSDSTINSFCLLAYSMGVPFAIKYASMYPNRVKGLILCDYQAKFPRIPESWVESVLKKGYVSVDRAHVVKCIQKDSQEISLKEDLKNIRCPVLIIKGGQEDSLLNQEATNLYIRNLRSVEVIEFPNSGHELWEPDYTKFIETIKQFLCMLDVTYKNS
ncbi:alpha/beta hydrolase [Evansella sp. AB-P1]|uniref:alpha/beta fold hydrolase n=1 Tax=Evansella sp. AB-P1 TaxID=3037653 RepID=UPI00241FE240|nr:alpha/beta hydrolase [Evansella sp. AB-P1]MDG5788602.1 alpha/beta hydrolase [Evansella sp. AB-P1]